MRSAEFFHELECLNLGILGPKIAKSDDPKSIDTALALLSPDESRQMRRKFRKVARQIINRKTWPKMTSKQKRYKVHRELYIKCLLRTYKMDYMQGDNDP